MLELETNSLITTKSSSSSSKEDLSSPHEPERRPWSDLPGLVLEQISNSMAILELLSFRGACREWRRLASHSKAESSISYRERPWFLLYGKFEYPNCNLYDPSSKRIYSKINIPALGEGVKCIASKGGWLLLYRFNNRSVFFFCPFSGARIDLPKLPHVRKESYLFNRIATFTSPPTSPDCIVCVCTQTRGSNRSNDHRSIYAVHTLRRGANEWETQPEYVYPQCPFWGMAFSAAFWQGTIHFVTHCGLAVSFSLETKQWKRAFAHGICKWREYFSLTERLDKGKFGLKDIDSLSICGTEMQGDTRRDDNITSIFDEKITGSVADEWKGIPKHFNPLHLDMPIEKKYKGVWIQPRFFQLPPDYRW